MNKLVNLFVSELVADKNGLIGKKEMAQYPSITMSRAMELIAEYDTLHDEGKIRMIDFTVQYLGI